ncbi:MAG TPA: 5-formyltetrahydrofolate cyclo-ligase [Thermaerobacter sp.]
MLYAPMPTEVDVSPLLDWARLRGIAVLLPWIDPRRGRMEARCVRSWDEVVPAPGQIGPWRLRQPADACPVWEPGTDTVIVVPGLAFDRHGWRLGRGGGYYDRFLAQWPAAWRVAVAPARMVVERLPRDPHDRRMDLIVTEGGVQGPWWGIR